MGRRSFGEGVQRVLTFPVQCHEVTSTERITEDREGADEAIKVGDLP